MITEAISSAIEALESIQWLEQDAQWAQKIHRLIVNLRHAKAEAEKQEQCETVARELKAIKQEQDEPVAWCVTFNGDFTGNIFENKRLADLCKRNLDAKYGSEDVRKIVPIYTTPQTKQEQGEPVAITITGKLGNIYSFTGDYSLKKGDKVYTKPTQRTWVGLTDVEWMNIVNKDQAWFGQRPDEVAHEVAKLVEAKLKEKNT